MKKSIIFHTIFLVLFSYLFFKINDIKPFENRTYHEKEVVEPVVNELPDFSLTNYKTIRSRNKAFFELLRPLVIAENNRLLKEKDYIQFLFNKRNLRSEEIVYINKLAKKYRVYNFAYQNYNHQIELLKKIDVIPLTLVLSQAAIESAWGTSYFARRANNLFGMHTLAVNKGIKPRGIKNPHFAIAKYDTVNESIIEYMKNLNRHRAYRVLRDIRAQLRKKGDEVNGFHLAEGLVKYSALGQEYVRIVRRTIKQNRHVML